MRGLTAREIERRAAGPVTDRVVLDYEGRFLRRRTLTTVSGASLFIDLPETVSLDAGDAFVTTDGARIAVEAAAEPLMEITAPPPDLVRFAWHIGNRHTPAQIEADETCRRELSAFVEGPSLQATHPARVSRKG